MFISRRRLKKIEDDIEHLYGVAIRFDQLSQRFKALVESLGYRWDGDARDYKLVDNDPEGDLSFLDKQVANLEQVLYALLDYLGLDARGPEEGVRIVRRDGSGS